MVYLEPGIGNGRQFGEGNGRNGRGGREGLGPAMQANDGGAAFRFIRRGTLGIIRFGGEIPGVDRDARCARFGSRGRPAKGKRGD